MAQSRNLAVAPRASETVLARLDDRISDPQTPVNEAIIFTQIRGEIIRQEEFREDRRHLRRAKNLQLYGKFGFSILGVGTGIWLITTGLHLEGFVLLGIGFHWLAPNFVKEIFGSLLGGKEKGDAE